MRNIWNLFINDCRRLTSNVVTTIIVLGLVFMPSMFSWYNVLACWDVFDNTGNMKVAVANVDEGYQSDLVPLKINVGEQVVSALRANDQLNWVFTTEDDAIDGARSGKYYAAVVIPETFSQDMMTFYSDDVEHAQIVYYTNEKKSAVAPKVTDQGADTISYQVNQTFMETMSDVALSIATSVSNYADQADANGQLGELANHITAMGNQMQQASTVVSSYSNILGAAQGLVSGSGTLLSQAQGAVGDISSTAGQGEQAIASITDAVAASSDALSAALKQSGQSYDEMGAAVDKAFAETNSLAVTSVEGLRNRADAAGEQVTQMQSLLEQLKAFKETVPPDYRDVVQQLIDQVQTSIDSQILVQQALAQAADDIESGNADAQKQHQEINDLIAEAKASLSELSTNYEHDIKPTLNQLAAEVAVAVQGLESSACKLDQATNTIVGSTGSVSSQIGASKDKLNETATNLTASAAKLQQLGQTMIEALNSGDMVKLREVLTSDPANLASALAAPIALDRHAVFPADNFGSQMAPLYTTLALWIGALLLVVAIKVNVSQREQDELDNPRMHQLFLGRFGVFSLVAFLQTTCMAVGNMLFLGIQANNPLLYLICFWVAGQVFTFIMYSLVVSFANLGKACGVLLLILQVTAAGGSFPLQLLPQFFQDVSPYVPATHVINAMRAAMMGVYQNDFWIEIGVLLLFLIPFALLGLVLRKPLMKFMNWYIEKVEDSKLVA